MSRDDYGDDRREGNKLVPAALTAYRHFYMTVSPLGGAQLTPMTGTDAERADVYRPEGKTEFQAKCLPYISPYGNRMSRSTDRYPYGKEHPVPSLECTCGFYAHYFPETDFYQDGHWTVREDFRDDPYGYRVIVRAAVEISGRVVAGDLGVRGEKMKVKAVAIDWAKCLVERESPPVRAIGDDFYSFLGQVFETRGTRERFRPIDPALDRWMIESVHEQLANTAYRYGAVAYDDAEGMYADFPQQDLSALGINAMTQEELTAKKRREAAEARAAREAQIAAYSRQVADTFQGVSDTFQSFTAALNTITVDMDISQLDVGAPSAQDVTRAELDRLMEKKRNRPAPPGTGIDRRKKHL